MYGCESWTIKTAEHQKIDAFELWCWGRLLIIPTGDRDQDRPHGKEMQKSKWLSERALQIAMKRREAKSKGEKERYTHLNAEFQRRARREKKPFSLINAKK